MTTVSCPTAEQLDDLRANRLPTAEAEALRQHLRGCAACQQRVAPTPAANSLGFLAPPRGDGELGWLDEFRIVGVLGQGGMAIVFDAEDTNLHRYVALKVLRPDCSDAVTQQRFLREARLLASLPHDHIVTVFQVGDAHGIPYLTMERLVGELLETRLKADRWLPLAEALRIAREAAEGLAVAHDKGLVHRDVKPANIWLESRSGRPPRIKLLDFGIARMVAPHSGLTFHGQILGTPMFMAPEQAAGVPVDGRADLYSLGCVLFQMLTGQPPFAADGPDTRLFLKQVIKGDAPRIAQVVPELPPPVAQLIQELLARNPDDRPANARVVVERLRALEAEGRAGTTAARPAPAPSLARRLARQPGALGILLGGLVILAAIVVSIVTAYSRLVPPRDDDAGTGEAAAPTGPPLRVGVLHSLTGTVSVHERPIVHATQLAVADINAAGGVLGRLVETVIEDGASDEAVFAEKARGLIEDARVEVLFGCYSSAARKRVAEVCARHDRLLFYPAGYEGLEKSPHVVYLGGTPNQTLIPLIRWAYAEAGKRRFFLVGSETVYCAAVVEILRHEITRLGATTAAERLVPLGEINFTEIVREVRSTNADIIVNLIEGQSNVAFCHELRAAEIRPDKVPTVWNSLSESELSLFRISDLVSDYSVAAYFDTLPGAANRAFLDHFHQRFGPSERVNDAMVTAYAGVMLWKKAVEQAGTTATAAVRKRLPGLSVPSPAGPLELAANLHAYRTGYIGEIVRQPRPDFRIVAYQPRALPSEPFPAWRSEAEWQGFLQALYRQWGDRWEKHR